MEVYDNKNNCYGCSACMNICSKGAIAMEVDEEGFMYPFIDDELCNNCGRCKVVCPIYDKKKVSSELEQQVYAVKHTEEATRAASTSGAMFTAISDYILDGGGSVYGAAFDDRLKVCHKRAVTPVERDDFRGSKYVQSDMDDIFKHIRKDLKEGKRVLFTGTPCQTDGLRSYLKGMDDTNLILCDIVCHGVPSPLMWQEYTKLVNRRSKNFLKTHIFRTKIQGWHRMLSSNVFQNGKIDSKSILSQVHMRLFLSNVLLRPCCYHCNYATFQRFTDITIGDFWGIEKTMPDFDDNKGVSLVLTNTTKGKDLLAAVAQKLELRKSSPASCLQGNLEHPTPCPPQRDEFWSYYFVHGYERAAKKYAGYSWFHQLKQTIYHLLRGFKITNSLKRLLRIIRRGRFENSDHNLS